MSRTLPATLPIETGALVRLLDECFPHRCPRLGANPDEVQRYAGKRDLIDLLLSRLADPSHERSDETKTNWLRGGA